MKLIRQEHEVTFRTRWFSITFSRVGQKREELYTKGIWITKDGKQIPIVAMDDSHLTNTIRWIERKADELASQRHPSPWSLPEPRGEMALDAYYCHIDEADFACELVRESTRQMFKAQFPFEQLIAEALVRGLPVLRSRP